MQDVVRTFLLLGAMGVFAFGFAQGARAVLSDGALVRADGMGEVYYIEDDKKRWVDSAETFRAQGFSWDAVLSAPPDEIDAYEGGEPITLSSQIIMPGEEEVLPDLYILPPFNFHFATKLERTILKFSSTFWNAGKGPLELVADPAEVPLAGEEMAQNVYQRIVRKDGSERWRLAGTFEWHDPHEHYHFHDFVDYIFTSLDSPDAPPLMQEKATRCIQDWEPIDLGIPGASSVKGFPKCTKDRQGISVGWGDLYEYTLADQYLDVNDLPEGNYRLVFKVNPRNLIVEARTDNNLSFADLRLNPRQRTMEVIEFAAPCWHNWHKLFPEGTLVRGEEDSKVYVLHRGKKRWLRTEEIFNSYGYPWEKIQVLPQSIVDSIPYNNLVRAGGHEVYALNDFGYTRHIRSQEVFASYNFSWNDIADVNATEFAAYSGATLVQMAGDADVYDISGVSVQRAGTVAELREAGEANLDALHVINAMDFQTYSDDNRSVWTLPLRSKNL